jgi:phosphoglycolate phosphatase
MRGSLLFDLDGTLTDPREGIVGSLRHALAALGVPEPSDDELGSFIGPPLHGSLRRLLGPKGASEVPRALELYRERFATVGMFENRVYPGIPEALAALRAAEWSLFVVTSKPSVFAAPILEHFDLTRYFAGVYGAELSGERSDKAELIAHFLRTQRMPAERTTMIGDRKHDIVGARVNRVRALGVLWGYGTRDELTDAGADGLYETVADLVGGLLPRAPD